MKKIIASILILSSLVYAGGKGHGMKQGKMFQSVPMEKATYTSRW